MTRGAVKAGSNLCDAAPLGWRVRKEGEKGLLCLRTKRVITPPDLSISGKRLLLPLSFSPPLLLSSLSLWLTGFLCAISKNHNAERRGLMTISPPASLVSTIEQLIDGYVGDSPAEITPADTAASAAATSAAADTAPAPPSSAAPAGRHRKSYSVSSLSKGLRLTASYIHTAPQRSLSRAFRNFKLSRDSDTADPAALAQPCDPALAFPSYGGLPQSELEPSSPLTVPDAPSVSDVVIPSFQLSVPSHSVDVPEVSASTDLAAALDTPPNAEGGICVTSSVSVEASGGSTAWLQLPGILDTAAAAPPAANRQQQAGKGSPGSKSGSRQQPRASTPSGHSPGMGAAEANRTPENVSPLYPHMQKKNSSRLCLVYSTDVETEHISPVAGATAATAAAAAAATATAAAAAVEAAVEAVATCANEGKTLASELLRPTLPRTVSLTRNLAHLGVPPNGPPPRIASTGSMLRLSSREYDADSEDNSHDGDGKDSPTKKRRSAQRAVQPFGQEDKHGSGSALEDASMKVHADKGARGPAEEQMALPATGPQAPADSHTDVLSSAAGHQPNVFFVTLDPLCYSAVHAAVARIGGDFVGYRDYLPCLSGGRVCGAQGSKQKGSHADLKRLGQLLGESSSSTACRMPGETAAALKTGGRLCHDAPACVPSPTSPLNDSGSNEDVGTELAGDCLRPCGTPLSADSSPRSSIELAPAGREPIQQLQKSAATVTVTRAEAVGATSPYTAGADVQAVLVPAHNVPSVKTKAKKAAAHPPVSHTPPPPPPYRP